MALQKPKTTKHKERGGNEVAAKKKSHTEGMVTKKECGNTPIINLAV